MVARSETLGLEARPLPEPDIDRMVVVDDGGFSFSAVSRLPEILRPRDLLVLNDAATLPAALVGTLDDGTAVELRLARFRGDGVWEVGVLGAGDWRTPTERRGPPPLLSEGQRITLGAVSAVVRRSDGPLAEVALEAEGGWLAGVYRSGQPVRYSYLADPVGLPAFQTGYASRPWASESPSAGLPLRWRTLLALRSAGVGLATLTHAAGLSSVDGGSLDARLPLPERSDIPQRTVEAVARARAAGGRIVAVGTTVVRALEGRVAEAGALVAGERETSWLLDGRTPARVVDGLLTKLHEPSESHFRVLETFAARERLVDAFRVAAGRGFRNHEFGDSALVLGSR